MSIIERLKQKAAEKRSEMTSLALDLLIADCLERKRKIWSEEVFARRIEVALRQKEFQVETRIYRQSEEPISVKLIRFLGVEGKIAVFLLVNEAFVVAALGKEYHGVGMDYLYAALKATLQTVDEMRLEGIDVIKGDEFLEMLKEKKGFTIKEVIA